MCVFYVCLYIYIKYDLFHVNLSSVLLKSDVNSISKSFQTQRKILYTTTKSRCSYHKLIKISTYQRQALWSLVIFVKTGYKKKDISAIKNTFAINGFFSHSFSLRLPICNVLSNNLAVCRILIGVVRMFAGGCPSKHSVDHSEIKPFQYPSPLKESVGL